MRLIFSETPRLSCPATLRGAPLVTILLAAHEGEAVIGAQLDSIAGQSHRNWQLIVSDDGSHDATPRLVEAFAATRPAGQVRLVAGPRRGAAQNFLHLLAMAPEGLTAFCDQDDLWFPDKLARAVAALEGIAGPAHYAARTVIADPALRPLTDSRRFPRPPGFRNALVQAIMAGNTTLLNAPAAAALQACLPAAAAAGIEAHDWWAYQITAGIGAHLIHDPQPVLLYRQHAGSLMGRNDTLPAMALRLGKLFSGDYRRWLGANIAALTPVRDRLTAENRAVLDGFAAALACAGPRAATRLRRLGIHRQTRAGSAALLAAAGLGRLRLPRSRDLPLMRPGTTLSDNLAPAAPDTGTRRDECPHDRTEKAELPDHRRAEGRQHLAL